MTWRATCMLVLLLPALMMVTATTVEVLPSDPPCLSTGIQWPSLQSDNVVDMLSTTLRDARPVPKALPPLETMEAEASTYRWIRHALDMQAWAACPLIAGMDANSPMAPAYPAPPGWRALRVLSVSGWYLGAPTAIPVGVVLRRSDCGGGSGGGPDDALVVLLRGLLLPFEQMVAAESLLVPLPPAFGVPGGAAHMGGLNGSTEVFERGLAPILDLHMKPAASEVGESSSACAAPASSLLFVGHSMGGGAAQLLGLLAARHLARMWGDVPGGPPLLSAVLFGAPPIGNEALADAFGAAVNVRSLVFAADPMPALGISWTLDGSPIQLRDDGVAGPAYALLRGMVRIGADTMPGSQQAAWQAIATAVPAAGPPQTNATVNYTSASGKPVTAKDIWMAAVHTCSYVCHTSPTLSDPRAAEWCILLHSQGEGNHTSSDYCLSYDVFLDGTPIFPTSPSLGSGR